MDALRPNDLFHGYLLVRKITSSRRPTHSTAVWLATSTRGLPCAVVVKIQKTLVPKMHSEMGMRVHNEAAILQKNAGHPNVVELVESFQTREDEVVIVFKYCQGGTLVDQMDRQVRQFSGMTNALARALTHPSGVLKTFVQRAFVQMVEGVHYMHQRGVAHMDIKLENVCIDGDGNVVIIDWEFSLLLLLETTEPYLYTNPCGTLGYAPPEVIYQWPYDPRGVDVWCLGVCLYGLVFGSMPFPIPSAENENNPFSNPVTFPEETDEHLEKLLEGMLTVLPENRMSLEDVKAHRAFCCMAHDLRRTSEEGCESGEGTPRSAKSSSDAILRPVSPISESGGFEPESPPTSPRTAFNLLSILKRMRNRVVRPGPAP